MGDSETECSECESPILYSKVSSGSNPTAVEVARPEPQHAEFHAPAESQQNAFASQFESESQFPFPETQTYQESIGTLDALAGLDSMLANPISLVNRTSIVPLKPIPAKQISRTPSATQAAGVRVRTLDRILEKIPKQDLNRYSLSAQLDVTDMRLLIHSCGEVVPSKTTKGTLCDKLLHLIECGALGKVFNSVQSLGVQSSMSFAPNVVTTPVPLISAEPLSETYVDTQPLQRSSSANQLQRASSVRSDTQATQASSRAVLVAEADPDLWAPVTDAALLGQLHGKEIACGVGAAPFKVEFTPSRRASGVFFAEQPEDAWSACDADTQRVLQERDPTHKYKNMLQRLSQSRAGVSSGIRLSTSFSALVGSTEEARPPSQQAEKPPPDFQALIDSLRSRLAPIAPPPDPRGSLKTGAAVEREQQGGSQASGTVKEGGTEKEALYDSMKLAVFRHDKLGLSLVRQVSPSGVERVVIQAKSHGALDPCLDRLLSVGDELVAVQGRPITTIGTGAGGGGGSGGGSGGVGSFGALMEFLKQAPRPLQLGFVPAGTLRAVKT